MITLEAADLIEGDASTAAEVDYTINGVQEASSVVSIVALASGQLAGAKATLYTTPGSTTAIVKSIFLVNTGAAARTVNLYVQSDGSNSRRVIPEDLSLDANGGTAILSDHLYVFDSIGQLKTVSATGTHALLDGSIASDTAASAVTKGDLVIGNATPAWDDLGIGTDNHHLVVATDLPAWEELDISHDLTPTLGGELVGGGNDIKKIGVLTMTEQADAESDVAGDGQIWVNTATPNELYFTTDAGNDIALTTGTGKTAPLAHKDSHDPSGGDPLDTAAAAEISVVVAAGEGTAETFARSDHAHAINHAITDNHLVTVDGTANDTEHAVFTADGIAGLTDAELLSALSGDADAAFDWGGQNLTNVADIVLNNNETLRWKDSGGTDRSILHVGAANSVVFDSSHIQAASPGDAFLIRTNNDSDVITSRFTLTGGVATAVATWSAVTHTGLVLSGALDAGSQDIGTTGDITVKSDGSIIGAGTGANGIVLKNPKNAAASALSGTQLDVEIDIGGVPYHFTVYPTKA